MFTYISSHPYNISKEVNCDSIVGRQISFHIDCQKVKDLPLRAEFTSKLVDIHHLVLTRLSLVVWCVVDVFHTLWFNFDFEIVETRLID